MNVNKSDCALMPTNKITEVHTDFNDNKVLYSSVHDWIHSGSASAIIINSVMTGTEQYYLDSHVLKVNRNQYLVINKAQSFEVSIEYSRSPVTGFAVYLSESTIEDVARNFQLKETNLLDNPFSSGERKFEFFESIYSDDRLQLHLQRLETRLNKEKNSIDIPDHELYFILAKELLLVQGCISKNALNIHAKNSLVKRELYKRVRSAKLILDETSENLKISDLAASVALSEFHFYRTFKQAFGISPHLYQTQKKLEKAAILLKQEDLPIGEIAYSVGFNDIFSFSKAFKHLHHLSPLQYRKKYSRI